MDYLAERGLGYLSSNLKVGDTLTYTRRYSDESVQTVVSALTKTTVKCENGTVWNIRTGRLWGTGNSWRSSTAYVVRDAEKVAKLKAERAAGEAEKKERCRLAAEVPSLVHDFSKRELEEVIAVIDGVKRRKAAVFLADYFTRWGA